MATVPAEYKILEMNANGDARAGMRKKRKGHIANLLRSESPLVVCLQEFLWKGIHSPAFKKLNVPDHFQYVGHKEASFIFDTRKIKYSRIDNELSVQNMYDNMVRNSTMSSDYFELSRICVCKIQSDGTPNFEILCASWHGPHNGFTEEKKKRCFDTLVEFLLALKVKENVPLLLGGDFNMPAFTVESGLPDCLMLHTPYALSIDMLIVSSDILKIFSISNVHTMERNSAFDHLHLEINLITVNDTNPQPSISTVCSDPIPQHSTIISSASSYPTLPYNSVTILWASNPYYVPLPYNIITILWASNPYYVPPPYNSITIPWASNPYHVPLPYNSVTIPWASNPYHVPLPYNSITIPWASNPYHVPLPYNLITRPWASKPYHVPLPYNSITIPWASNPYHVPPPYNSITIPWASNPYHVPLPYNSITILWASNPYHVPLPYNSITRPWASKPYHVPPSYNSITRPWASNPYHVPPSYNSITIPRASNPYHVPLPYNSITIPRASNPYYVPPTPQLML